jgi:hypothetical protein
MSQSPRPEDPALNLEALSAEELERAMIALCSLEKPQPSENLATPPHRRCDSNHREILRQPFFLDR